MYHRGSISKATAFIFAAAIVSTGWTSYKMDRTLRSDWARHQALMQLIISQERRISEKKKEQKVSAALADADNKSQQQRPPKEARSQQRPQQPAVDT